MDLLYSISMLTVSAGSFILAILILKNGRGKRPNFYFSLVLLCAAVWSFGRMMAAISWGREMALFWIRLSYTGGIWIIPAFLLFSVVILEKKFNFFRDGLAIITFALFWLLSFTGYFIQDVQPKLSFRFYEAPFKPVFELYTFLFALILVYAGYELWKGFLAAKGNRRAQLGYILLSSLIGFVPSATTFPLVYGFPLYPFGVPVIAFFPFVFAYAVTKHHLMDISVVISRAVAELLTVILLGSLYAGFVSFYYSRVSFMITLDFIFWTVLYGIFVGQAHQRVRIFIQTTSDKIFLRGKYDYYKELSEISSRIARSLSLDNILSILRRTFYEVIEVSDSRVYFSRDFVHPGIAHFETEPEIRRLGEAGEPKFEKGKLILPCVIEDRLVAVIVLGKKLSEDAYTDEDLRLLKSLANQTAVALEHIRTYEELKSTQTQLDRSQRLASLGTLAAGIAHEIRNPLGIIHSKTEKLDDELRDMDYLKAFKESVIRNSKQISTIITSMLELSRDKEKKKITIDLNGIIDSTLPLISIGNARVEKELSSIPAIKGDPEDLRRVFINLFNNAIEAMPEGGELKVSTYMIGEGASARVCVDVADDGQGIAKDDLPKVFDPFFSTRADGVGLGLSIVYGIVRENDGVIEIKNREAEGEKGTVFTLRFPACL